MNNIALVGRLVKDVEIEQTTNKTDYTRFTLASKSKNKDRDGKPLTNFFLCVAWREKAQLIKKYCKKGDLVFIKGSMDSRTYQRDGKDNTLWEVNVEDIEFCSTFDDKVAKDRADKVPSGARPYDDGTPFDDEDLPF